jgi:hypothetical protein
MLFPENANAGFVMRAIICDPDSLITAPSRLGRRLPGIVVQLPQLGFARLLASFSPVLGSESWLAKL